MKYVVLLLLTVVCLVGFYAKNAEAHFALNANIRILHVSHQDNSPLPPTITLYLRLPMSYLVADKLGLQQDDGSFLPAPFTFNRFDENNKLMHYVDVPQILANPLSLAKIAANGVTLSQQNKILIPQVQDIRLWPALLQSPFSSLLEAQNSFSHNKFVYPPNLQQDFVGNTIVDVKIVYEARQYDGNYSISFNLDPNLPQQEDTANVIVDHFQPKKPLIFRLEGLLLTPYTISRSLLLSVTTFIKQGMIHILNGYDHLLFVVCLTLAALSLKQLVWQVTGFTIGHSATLALGFFQIIPQTPSFVLLVEVLIALSIIYVAAISMLKVPLRSTLLVTPLIGLLHGMGFSYVLRNILSLDDLFITPALISFNIGVELGQLLIVSLTLLLLLPFKLVKLTQFARISVYSLAIVVSCYWLGERSWQLLQVLTDTT